MWVSTANNVKARASSNVVTRPSSSRIPAHGMSTSMPIPQSAGAVSFTGNIGIEGDANATDAIVGLGRCSSRTSSSMAEKSNKDRGVWNNEGDECNDVLFLLISIIGCTRHRIVRRIVEIIQVVTELRLLLRRIENHRYNLIRISAQWTYIAFN